MNFVQPDIFLTRTPSLLKVFNDIPKNMLLLRAGMLNAMKKGEKVYMFAFANHAVK